MLDLFATLVANKRIFLMPYGITLLKQRRKVRPLRTFGSRDFSHRVVGAIKKIDTLWGFADYGMLDLFATLVANKRIFLMPYGITLLKQRRTVRPLRTFGSRDFSHRVVGAIKKIDTLWGVYLFYGADYGARTRHLRLGKATLYQMS